MGDESSSRPRAPAGLGSAGKRLWSTLTSEYDFVAHELAILATACHQADDVAAVEGLIAEQGLVTPGSNGQPRLSAALTEVRQGRLALGKLLGLLALPDEEARPMSAASRQAKKAADARWGRKRLEQERRAEALRREAHGG